MNPLKLFKNPTLTILTTLNRKSADVFKYFEIHAVTDITGFGLAGHALEMAGASRPTAIPSI